MDKKEFEEFIEKRLEEIRQEWVKYAPGNKGPINIAVFNDSVSAFAFEDDTREVKCVDFWRWHDDDDS